MATGTDTDKRAPKKDRSPSYPAIDLQDALQRASALYKIEKQHYTPVQTAMEHWGFGPSSSQGQVILAALKKFGLIEDEGRGPQRQVRLTKDAVSMIIDQREDSAEKAQAIQRAALKPAIHKAMWDKYGASLPSDANLRHWLLTQPVPFTERGADEFIPEYKRTLAFAKLGEAGKLPDGEVDKIEPREDPPLIQQPPGRVTSGTEVVRFPIRVGVWGKLEVPSPMTEDDWQRMLRGIEAQKLGLVADAEDGDDG